MIVSDAPAVNTAARSSPQIPYAMTPAPKSSVSHPASR